MRAGGMGELPIALPVSRAMRGADLPAPVAPVAARATGMTLGPAPAAARATGITLAPAARALGAAILLAALSAAAAGAITLREAYEQAGPLGGYDKHLELETGRVYTGGLLIGPTYGPLTWDPEGEPGGDVRIVGNGAILDLQGEQICISFCNRRLDIEDCVVLDGNIRFRGLRDDFLDVVPTGSVRHVTFWGPHDYGVRLQGAGGDIVVERNLCVDAIDTGPDFIFSTGIASDCLPTGTSYSASVFTAIYGTPALRSNWSFHSDPARNSVPLAHFHFLCEHG